MVLATIYLGNCGYDATSLCSIPAILTMLALVGFIALPALRMINGNERLDDDYVRALSVVLVGFLAFWVGSWLTMKQSRLRFVPTTISVPARTALSAFCMLIIGVTASVIGVEARDLRLYGRQSDPAICFGDCAVVEPGCTTTQWSGLGFRH